MKTKTAIDKYQQLNEQLIKLLEQDLPPWKQDWRSQGFGNLFSTEPYKGVNPIICLISSMTNEYKSSFFVSFNQAKEKGWQVKKGSKATSIVFATKITKEDKDDSLSTEKSDRQKPTDFYMSRWSNVFNLDCIDDTKAEKKISDYLEIKEKVNCDRPVANLEKFVNNQGVEIITVGDSACYSSQEDKIYMPSFDSFTNATGYYSTVLHELAHSTGHSSRLNRPLGNKFGSPEYAFEELIAEIASCMVCQDLAVDYQLENHASYLKSWISRLHEDKTAFVRAMSKAQSACNYLLEKGGYLDA
jgi:antirestriction protein ArdC